MTSEIRSLAWPVTRLAEALRHLAEHDRTSGEPLEGSLPPPPMGRNPEPAVGAWLESLATWLGLEAIVVDATYGGAEQLLSSAAPAVLRLPTRGKTASSC